MTQIIEHKGIINKIDNNRIDVLINQQTACSECHANGICFTSDAVNKVIEVENADPVFKIGDNVILYGKQSLGLQAVLLAFVFPSILLLITLILLNSVIANEIISGIISVLVLLPYYLILSIFNKKIKANFRFDIKKGSADESEFGN
ncbi:MAG: SoxR reducing system RseC family protein [Bacteroidota bacterium]|nr:SoxR reducing system RseC family protein [Bacteroidota bacterium]